MMSLCHFCLTSLADGMELCDEHIHAAPEWATENKTACDFFHRGIEASAPPPEPSASPPLPEEPLPEWSYSDKGYTDE